MPLTKQLSVLLGLALSGTAYAQVDKLLGGGANAMDLYTRYTVLGNVNNVSVVADPAGGTKSVLLSKVASSDALVAGSSSAAVVPKSENTLVGLRWYALSFYFPTNWVSSSIPVTVAAIDTASAPSLRPPVAIVARDGNVEMTLTDNHRTVAGADPATVANSASETFRMGKLVTGKWYCFVVRAEWYQTLGAGNMTVWLNANKVYDAQRAINNYGSTLGNVPKVGLMYNGAMDLSSRTLYTDFVRLGGLSSYVEQMYAETPCAGQAAASFLAAKAATASMMATGAK